MGGPAGPFVSYLAQGSCVAARNVNLLFGVVGGPAGHPPPLSISLFFAHALCLSVSHSISQTRQARIRCTAERSSLNVPLPGPAFYPRFSRCIRVQGFVHAAAGCFRVQGFAPPALALAPVPPTALATQPKDPAWLSITQVSF